MCDVVLVRLCYEGLGHGQCIHLVEPRSIECFDKKYSVCEIVIFKPFVARLC